MNPSFKQSIWKQFGAAIDMLENAITECPNDLWNTDSKFWYKAYHSLFYLDYYLTTVPDKFSPPLPFTLSEFDSSGKMPERVYTKEELLTYLQFCKTKCHDLIKGLTDESIAKRWVNSYRDYSIFEILIYNMRHIQHHAGQLYLLLRQGMDNAPAWVSQTPLSL